MGDCCVEFTELEDQIVTDSDTICGATLQAIDLSTLLTTQEQSQSPVYDILTGSGNKVASVALNGSVLEFILKNPDNRPYSEVVVVGITSEDNFKYKVRVQTNFLDRCADAECLSDEYCDECSGDCVEGEVDLVAGAEVLFGKVNLTAG